MDMMLVSNEIMDDGLWFLLQDFEWSIIYLLLFTNSHIPLTLSATHIYCSKWIDESVNAQCLLFTHVLCCVLKQYCSCMRAAYCLGEEHIMEKLEIITNVKIHATCQLPFIFTQRVIICLQLYIQHHLFLWFDTCWKRDGCRLGESTRELSESATNNINVCNYLLQIQL